MTVVSRQASPTWQRTTPNLLRFKTIDVSKSLTRSEIAIETSVRFE